MSHPKTARKSTTPRHGGKREGAGRKPSVTERAVTRSLSLPPTGWALVDKVRGTLTRSAYLLAKAMQDDLASNPAEDPTAASWADVQARMLKASLTHSASRDTRHG